MYTAAYLGVNPILQEELMKSQNETVKQPMVAMMLASCVSGSSAAFITHPLDTIKTRMQANVDKIIYRFEAYNLTWFSPTLPSIFNLKLQSVADPFLELNIH